MEKNYNRKIFGFYWQHLKPYRWLVLTTLLFLVVATVSYIITPIYYKQFFNSLTGVDNTEISLSSLFQLLWIILVIKLITWSSWRIISFSASYFDTKAMADIYNSSFAYLHKHSVNFFNNNFTGALVKKVNRFVLAFGSIMEVFLWSFFPSLIMVVSMIYVLSKLNVWIGISLFIWVLIFCLSNYFFSLYKLKYDTKRAALDSKVGAALADTVTNHLNVKLFNGYNREKNNFKQITSDLQKMRQFTWNLTNVFDAFQVLLMFALEIGLMFYAVKLWQKDLLSIGDFVLIQSYVIALIDRLWDFGRVVRHYYEAMADAKEMMEILDTPHEIKDFPKAKPLQVSKGEIIFEQVSFSYQQTRQIIKDLNLNIKAKEKIALVGPSGGGKSTIVNLLLRQHDLSTGKIFIDGQDISKISQASLWQNIGMVNQDPILFHRSLSENIKYGKPDATTAELIRAAKLAHCHDFISTFTDAYDTLVGERGVRLSGGERQRVAIARAILKNAPILILDEATSSLDSESEELIQKALANLMQDKTVIVIAHRLSTIMKMDRIILINAGQVIEQGSHQELLKNNKGFYKKLWSKQAGGFIH